MNGGYKIATASVKRQLFNWKQSNYKTEADRKFKPTDIVPIVNKAWPATFGDVSKGRKTLVVRGWNPCNRALLSHPEVVKTKKISASATGSIDTDMNSAAAFLTSMRSTCVAHPSDVNIAAIGSHLDKLRDHEDEEVTKTRRMAKRQKDDNAWKEKQQVDKLIRSGDMMSVGKLTLGKEVLEHQARVHALKDDKEAKKTANACNRNVNQAKNVTTIREKNKNKPVEQWGKTDLKVMVACKKPVGTGTKASPAKHSKEELQAQYTRRINNPSPPKLPPPSKTMLEVADRAGKYAQKEKKKKAAMEASKSNDLTMDKESSAVAPSLDVAVPLESSTMAPPTAGVPAVASAPTTAATGSGDSAAMAFLTGVSAGSSTAAPQKYSI